MLNGCVKMLINAISWFQKEEKTQNRISNGNLHDWLKIHLLMFCGHKMHGIMNESTEFFGSAHFFSPFVFITLCWVCSVALRPTKKNAKNCLRQSWHEEWATKAKIKKGYKWKPTISNHYFFLFQEMHIAMHWNVQNSNWNCSK